MDPDILENARIQRVAKHFLKSPYKIHGINEADAEIIDLGKESANYLALTTDAVIEEISSGLYDHPFLIGWMVAMVNFSDLAAVGAEPLGLLVTMCYPQDMSASFIEKMAEGISQACKRLNTFVLGGDTNEAEKLNLSGCAAGLVPKQKTITRIGAKPGDKCYLSAPAGIGNIFAFLKLSGKQVTEPESLYRPIARLNEGKIVREFANCCMDTSDGVIHTLDALKNLNHCQFIVNDQWEKILHPLVMEICRSYNIPPWITLAGVHGEFELCFTIDPGQEKKFLQKAGEIGWAPTMIGEVSDGEGVSIKTNEKLISIDTGFIRNLSESAGSSHGEYIEKLLKIARNIGI